MSQSFPSSVFYNERQLPPQFSPMSLPNTTSMMSSPSFQLLPAMSHSTPVNVLPRPQPMLPGHLSPLNYSKLSPLASKSINGASFSPLSLTSSSPESAFSPVPKSSSDASKLSPLSHSYSPLSHPSAVTEQPTGYLSRLRSNPMFQDLQKLLAQECHHLQVPASLITSQWNLDNLQTAMAPHNTEVATREYAASSSQQVYTLHMQLQDRFIRLHGDKDLHEFSRRMESLYCSEVGRVEMKRYQSLCTSFTEQAKYSVNIHYNKERITLVERLQKEVDIITKSSLSNLPTTSTPISSKQSSFDSPESSTTDSLNELFSVVRPAEASSYTSSSTSTSSISTEASSSTSNASVTFSPETTPEESAPELPAARSRTGRLLSPETIKMLTQWYDAHTTYPYPSDEDVAQLAAAGGITAGQVRKWLANKRVRSFNTLSITGNDHPIKYKYRGKRDAEGSPLEVQVNRRPQYKLLSSAAKKTLNDWYDCHSENPYPTEEEKEDLAEKAGVSPAQVKSWFANKRSRNNNTKRQVPNYFIKKYPGYTPIVEMVSEQRAARKTSGKYLDRVRMDLYQPFNMV